MENKFLSLGKDTIKQLKETANKLGLNESMTTKIAIAMLYNKTQKMTGGIENLLKND